MKTIRIVFLLFTIATLFHAHAANAQAPTQPDADKTPRRLRRTPRCRRETRQHRKNSSGLAQHRPLSRRQCHRPASRQKRKPVVVFMGDSITDMWVQPQFGGFFPGKPYIDRGISGQTTPQMLIRFPPRRNRPASQSCGHPRRHERSRRQHRSDDCHPDRRQSHLHGRTSPRQQNSRGARVGPSGQQLRPRP